MSTPVFTGERFVPGQGSCQLAYEHLHRYALACRLAEDRIVLDVASGTGYGSALLAAHALQVWGVDIDPASVRAARRSFGAGNLHYAQADAGRLPFRDGSIGLALAFEVIEHLESPETLADELARVLAPEGAALVSTPDRAVYSDARCYRNPFHTREFYADEFLALLAERFPRVQLLSQQVRAGSLISGGDAGAGNSEILLEPLPGRGRDAGPATYMIALCSGVNSRVRLPENSAYLDVTDGMIGEWTDRIVAAGVEVERLNEEIAHLGIWGRDLEGEIQSRDETLRRAQARSAAEIESRDRAIRGLQDEMSREIAHRDELIARLQGEFESRTQWAMAMQQEVRERDDRLGSTQALLEAADARLARIRAAFPYRVLRRLGLLPP